MKPLLAACLLLLWTLTAPVSCGAKIKVTEVSNGIKLSCNSGYHIEPKKYIEGELLAYKDENSGEYTCVDAEKPDDEEKVFVKFRTCDNCVELDTGSLVGMIVGDVVATVMIGVAVYIIASQNRIGPVTSPKKSSDRQHLVPREVSRAPNDHYQPLKTGRQRETYDVLNKR
ncbi:T-cell surface glycoprotein CD3 epsilon chain-like [Cebidichthys violaceus]|uniref:T-cell surface glycoprotein CD3 epsilon chain-like n=1 Tax=Cebidichthys violaceus TaxID=271503 RepID=UPI0035CB949B